MGHAEIRFPHGLGHAEIRFPYGLGHTEIRFLHGPCGNLISFHQCNDDFTNFSKMYGNLSMASLPLTHTGIKKFEERARYFMFAQSYTPNSNESYDFLLFLGRFGRQGSTENVCNFAKLSFFAGVFSIYYHFRSVNTYD